MARRPRLTVLALRDQLVEEFARADQRMLACVDAAGKHAEERLQLEIGTLRADMNRRFDVVGTRFGEINDHFKSVDRRFDELDERFKGVDEHFKSVDKRFEELKGDINEIKGLIKNNHDR